MLSSSGGRRLADLARSAAARALSLEAAGRSKKGAGVAGAEQSARDDGDKSGGSLGSVKLSYTCLEDKRDLPRRSALVVHHSLMGCRKNFTRVAKEIHHLTHRKVVSLDARNHGDSPHTPEMSYALLVEDTRRLIGHLGEEKVSYMGHSMGGRVGMILALTRPQLIDKFICVDSTPINTPVSLDRWETQARACEKLKEAEAQLREKSGVARVALADEIIRPLIPLVRERSLFLTNLIRGPVPKEAASRVFGREGNNSDGESDGHDDVTKEQRLWRLNIDAFLRSPGMPASFPTFSGVSYKGPALFIAGEHSKFMKPEHEDEIKRLFPNAQITWIKGKKAGHWIHEDCHEDFMSAVLSFLENDAK